MCKFALILLLFMGNTALAVNIYVDAKNGRDSYNGSFNKPFKTIQAAADVAAPGDTVLVRPGVYGKLRLFNENGGGANGKYVTYKSTVKHGAIITTNDGDCIFSNNNSYIAIRDFKIINCAAAGIKIVGRYEFFSKYVNYKSRGWRISGNFISNVKHFGVGISGIRFGLRRFEPVAADLIKDIIVEDNEISYTNVGPADDESISMGRGMQDFIVRNNYIYESEQYGIDIKVGAENGEIYGNVVRDMERHGIYLDTSNHYLRNIKIYNNLVYWTGFKSPFWTSEGLSGIVLTRENTWDQNLDGTFKKTDRPAKMENIDIYNNTIVGANTFGILLYKHCYEIIGANCSYLPNGRFNGTRDISPQSTFKNIRIANNIISHTRKRAGIQVGATLQHPGTQDIRIFKNILWNNPTDINNGIASKVSVFGNVMEAPLYVNLEGHDYRLSERSPAVNNASTNFSLGFDLNQNSRDAQLDIGAYEFQRPGSGDGGGSDTGSGDDNVVLVGLIKNPSFENGKTHWISFGNSASVFGQSVAGARSIQVGRKGGGVRQDILGSLTPGATYSLTFHAKLNKKSEDLWVGINFLNSSGDKVFGRNRKISSTQFAKQTVRFTAPKRSDVDKAFVYIYKRGGDSFVYIDAFSIELISPPSE